MERFTLVIGVTADLQEPNHDQAQRFAAFLRSLHISAPPMHHSIHLEAYHCISEPLLLRNECNDLNRKRVWSLQRLNTFGMDRGAWWTLYVLTLHTVWNTSVAIALIEAFVPHRRTTPWLGTSVRRSQPWYFSGVIYRPLQEQIPQTGLYLAWW